MVRVKLAWKLESLELESFPCWPSTGSKGKSLRAELENETSCQAFSHLHVPVLHLAGSALALRWCWGRGCFSFLQPLQRDFQGKQNNWLRQMQEQKKASLGRWRCHLSQRSFNSHCQGIPLDAIPLPASPPILGYCLGDGSAF